MRSNRSSADPSDRWFYVAPQQQPSAFSQPTIFPQPQPNLYYPLPHDSVYATAAALSQSSPFLASSSAAQFPIPQWSQQQYPLTSSLASVAMALPHSAVDSRFLSAMQMQTVPAPLQHMQTSLSDLSLINPLTAQRQLTPTVYRRRASVSRSRTGCWQCRVRRKKCDDRKPKCLTCERLDICCMYGPCPENMRTVEDRRRAARELTVQIRAAVKRRSAERAARNSKAAAALPAPPSGLEVSVAMMREPLTEPSTALVSTDPKLAGSGYQLLPDIGPGPTAREEADRVPISPPAYFGVEIQTLDFDSPLSPLRVLQEYVDQIPRSIYSSHTDAARQLAYVVVYFRMAARILFPGLFLQTDDLIDCQTLVYSIAVQDAWVWRSICAIGSAFASMASSGVLAVDDVEFLTSGSTVFIEEANALMSEYPARNEGGSLSSRGVIDGRSGSLVLGGNSSIMRYFPRNRIERVMVLGWNVFTLARVLGAHYSGVLKTLVNLISHFGLLSTAEHVSSSPLLRIVTAHTTHADILVATNEVQPAILAATYGEMLDCHLSGGTTFRTGIATGIPISTALLLMLSRIVELEYMLWQERRGGGGGSSGSGSGSERSRRKMRYLEEMEGEDEEEEEVFSTSGSAYVALRVENAAAYLDGYVPEVDSQRTTTQRCSELMRLAVRIYLAVFCDPGMISDEKSERGQVSVEAREGIVVRESARMFLEILVEELLEDGGEEEEEKERRVERMNDQELERAITWGLVVVANVMGKEMEVGYGRGGEKVKGREILRRTFEESVSKGEFGGWERAWEVVKEVWKEENWAVGRSWRQVNWGMGPSYLPVVF